MGCAACELGPHGRSRGVSCKKRQADWREMKDDEMQNRDAPESLRPQRTWTAHSRGSIRTSRRRRHAPTGSL
eukprot:6684844-Heterocapsa_arctica.AAC.1